MAGCYMAINDIHNAMDRCMLALDMTEEIECPRPLQSKLHSVIAEIYDMIGDSENAEMHRAIAKRLLR